MSVTLIIIITTIILSLYSWSSPVIFERWMFNPYLITRRRQYLRFLTSGFIHKDFVHLFLNMFVLYSFGRYVEFELQFMYGNNAPLTFLIIYILAIVVADLPTFFQYRNVRTYYSLGASGAVSAIVFSSIMFNPLGKVSIIFLPVSFPGFVLGILYLIYSYYQGKRMAGNVNHNAHLFGALFGIAATVALDPNVIIEFISDLGDFRWI